MLESQAVTGLTTRLYLLSTTQLTTQPWLPVDLLRTGVGASWIRTLGLAKRVIKREVPLPKGLVQLRWGIRINSMTQPTVVHLTAS